MASDPCGIFPLDKVEVTVSLIRLSHNHSIFTIQTLVDWMTGPLPMDLTASNSPLDRMMGHPCPVVTVPHSPLETILVLLYDSSINFLRHL